MGELGLNITTQEIILRIVMAIIIGGAIGYERGQSNRPAGFRTHILVCLGATIVSLVQDSLRANILAYAITHPGTTKVVKTDLGRIGAKVVSGIGFLGAGTIMRGKGVIGGLTTAASIWVTACIGLGIGWGFYGLSILAGVAVLIALVGLKSVERSLIDNRYISKVLIEFEPGHNIGENIIDMYKTMKEMKIKIKSMKKDEEKGCVTCTLNIPKVIQGLEVVSSISKCESIKKVHIL
ncbi:Protein SapB [Fusobacterium sp. DD29]|uniref:MgtC/SapB family protein n=1 Tax=unclassified Fusobacterium TaxID=2648384 RepID=UPI001B8CE855|nr:MULTISPECIES: MgtC/SapB family protein [unclassified Fusobacterium]MBR8702313.1 Protein SapB [Fusobacterium sp. DD45]MBR8712133.1 Protein SapB [Fusobacterium sp. DD28]MBR8750337.1 Protein SapB [Fusobacterium sp. DD29]MBR8752712.1 Protein SapB [Fusobacterium sp. DD26]MBR8762578.1 Protein SapB [Fusobacterium sp. DD25]